MKFNEQQIKERRIVEAIQKEYMGFQGKFACIAKNLGHEILDQGQNNQTFISYDDFWQNDEENEIKEIDTDANIIFLGWFYCGLKIGLNLEIFVYENDKKIKVFYEGVIVYEEESGDLNIYIPNKIWEDKIENIYILARTKEKESRQESKENAKIEFERKKKILLKELNYKWGI